MIIHTSAIVLKSVDFQESSKIITLFTREKGKLAVIARGVKKPKSKFSGLIEPANLLDVVYYHKDSRSVQILSEASLLHKTLAVRTEFEKMAIAISAIELIAQLIHEGEVNKPLFDTAEKFLVWLNDTDKPVKKIFPYLQIRLAALSGIGIQLEHAGNRDSYYFDLESGNVTYDQVSSYSYKLTQNQFNYVNYAMQAKSRNMLAIDFKNGELKQLIDHFDRYFEFHIDGIKKRKSDAVFEQLMQE